MLLLRIFFIMALCTLSMPYAAGQTHNAIVADSTSRLPLPCASVFDCKGNVIGVCSSNGKMPYVPTNCYPITIRYLGFKDKVVPATSSDTIFLQEHYTELSEIVVESSQTKVLHMLGYLREYSTLTTYTDTIFLFREKMVDYMLTPNKKMRFKGWNTPRILKCKSYYRFTNASGLDSVSDNCNHHFSWSDWIGIVSSPKMNPKLRKVELGSDTIRGKYSPTETWTRNDYRVNVDVNVLADTTSRKWVPNLSTFFQNHLDFECFKVKFSYNNVVGDSISPLNLTGYSFNIESNGRGHNMFMFNRINEPFFVSTYAEAYIVDKEYITVKEAKKWDKLNPNDHKIEIYEPMEAPELQPTILALIDRVNSIDKDEVRLNYPLDRRFAGNKRENRNFTIGNRLLFILKQLTGISLIKSHKSMDKRMKDFRKELNTENERNRKDQ